MVLHRTAVIGTSLKPDERRVPIHPDHFQEIEPELRASLIFERGYGVDFGIADDEIAAVMGAVADRDEMLATCDISILPKPLAADLGKMKMGGTLWGWPHCVQQRGITQTAIDRRLTLIAWEAMNLWDASGGWMSHVFHRNNEIAGYAGVLHALELLGINGVYGPRRKAAVIGFGSVGRGALKALLALGFENPTVYVAQAPDSVKNMPSGIRFIRLETGKSSLATVDGAPFIERLIETDLIVNCILQDPIRPLHYLAADEAGRLKAESLIVDVSCDEGMGFPFARPTSFKEPMLRIGSVNYYAVDHTPSHLWNSASWEISRALLPYLRTVMSGPDAWQRDETVRRALEIRDGVIVNPQILSFQKRERDYPHHVRPVNENGRRDRTR